MKIKSEGVSSLSRAELVACIESACALAAARVAPGAPDSEWDRVIDDEYEQLLIVAGRLRAVEVSERERLWCEAMARLADDAAEQYRAIAVRIRARGAAHAAVVRGEQ